MGCYRSGTSAIAGVVHHLGVNMGKNFDAPNQNNMSGYWEDIDFKEFHKRFDTEKNDQYKFINDYIELIRNREKEFKLWGLKDPLLCTNLDKFVTNLKTDYKLIVCRRKIEDIAFSMGKAVKEKKYPMRFLPLADFYVQCMNQQLQKYRGPILELDHDQTLKNPKFHVCRISNFIGLPFKKKSIDHITNYKK